MQLSKLVALALAAALSASSATPPVNTTPETPCAEPLCYRPVGVDPAILVQEGNGSELMPLRARLQWVGEESCLVLVAEDEGRTRTVIPLWPKGAVPVRVDGRRGVSVPGAGRFLEGDALAGGGTWILPEFTPAYRFVGPPPARCGRHDGYFMIDAMGLEHP